MSFDTSTRLYGLLAGRIYVPIFNEKRSDTICIKPTLFFGADDGIRTRDLRLTKAVRYLLCHISIFDCRCSH